MCTLRHFSTDFELLPWKQNYRRYLTEFGSKESKNQPFLKDIELKFGIETNFGPLSPKTNKNVQSEVIMTFSAFRPFR